MLIISTIFLYFSLSFSTILCNMTHRGEIVEKAIRRSGFSLTKLAEKVGISRNTLYNKFKDADLSYAFIMEVGKVIHYDFTLTFPEMKTEIGPTSANPISQHREDLLATLWRLEGKYNQLLEKYNKLLEIVISIVDENDLYEMRQEIAQMLKK